ncbi:E3 ubiquitin-protein ligase TRIM62-like [Acipenser ruthenus]|uniref:E3 ubiquitin-protein ligase TRIM62-like n=1 Tax=Acipenser ruthenus TaxID=7906 RepID=UPI0027420ECA|nr:E3 ubiquitin-protein ligase TRIM62-like [Acipenser ruthenus]
MATAASPEEKFSCSVCLDLFTEPATIPCGHSFCLDCIGSYWDQSDQTGVYSCPQCRETFTPRPVLRKNNIIFIYFNLGASLKSRSVSQRPVNLEPHGNPIINELVEELKKTRLDSKRESPAAAPVSAELGDVPCDFCPSEIKRGAVRSCLTCRGSYCEAHLQPHYETAGLKRHALVQPLRDLEQKLCKQHQRLLEFYCRTDQSCICAVCPHNNHQDHDVILAERERERESGETELKNVTDLLLLLLLLFLFLLLLLRFSNIALLCICFCPSCSVQKELGERQAEIENFIEERLNQAVESLKLSAHKERAESEQVLSELIHSIERIRTEVGELIGAKEKAAVSRADQQREQLEQEIQELRKRKAEMEQLSETEDHIHFLQSFQSVCTPPAAQQLFDNIDDSFWTLRKAVSRLKDHLEGFWKVELMKATIAVDVTLDPDTAHPFLILSRDGKEVNNGNIQQPLFENQKRFDIYVNVLGRDGFTSGRHYWEVEVGGKIHWRLGVTRESSQRKGSFTVNPQQGFWIIWLNEENNQFYAATEPMTPLPLSLKPRKLGVYLDYEGGQLSFYNVETRSHIYTFTDSFTEKLYPLFSPGLCYDGKNAAPLIICPHTYTD